MRRRGSSSSGKNEPLRSFGIANVRSPALVESTFGRVPLRWVTRSGVRSHGSAPIFAVASVSINCCSAHWASSRTRSVPSPTRNASSRSETADSSRAIGVFSFGVHLVGTHPGSRRWLTSRWTRFPPRQGTQTRRRLLRPRGRTRP